MVYGHNIQVKTILPNNAKVFRSTDQFWNGLQQPPQRAGQAFETDEVVTWKERIHVRQSSFHAPAGRLVRRPAHERVYPDDPI